MKRPKVGRNAQGGGKLAIILSAAVLSFGAVVCGAEGSRGRASCDVGERGAGAGLRKAALTHGARPLQGGRGRRQGNARLSHRRCISAERRRWPKVDRGRNDGGGRMRTLRKSTANRQCRRRICSKIASTVGDLQGLLNHGSNGTNK